MADDLEELFKRAAAIASNVPESMQEAAFHRALDALQGAASAAPEAKARSGKRATVRSRPSSAPEPDGPDPVPLLLALDRSRASDVDDEDGAFDKSLALLRVAHRELGVDGLTASQIANVLTEKFRWRVTRQAIGQALDNAGRLVDRRRDARGTSVHRIMQAGEEYLDTPSADREAPSGHKRAARRAKKSASKNSTESPTPSRRASKKTTTTAPTTPSRPRKSGGSRQGPKGAVEALITEGFFSSPRGLGAVQQHLENDYALRYELTSLSPAFVRLVRERKLRRNRNADGQYEYIAAGS